MSFPSGISPRPASSRLAIRFAVTAGSALVAATAAMAVVVAATPSAARAESSVLPAPIVVQTGSALSRPEAVETLGVINGIRRRLNLPVVSLDGRLCTAAARHSAYLSTNGMLSHKEEPRLANYIAADPTARAAHFGFSGACYENIHEGVGTASDAVIRLLDAPYHRAPMLQPGAFSVGVGRQGNITTLLYAQSADSGVATYPADGQRDIPIAWGGSEVPSPLRVHPNAGDGPYGYPITLFAFAPDGVIFTSATITLTAPDGQQVPAFVNTPQNDDMLCGGVVLIPVHPLRPGVTYQAHFQATDDSGKVMTRSWSFTTAAAAASTPLAAARRPVAPHRG